MVIVMKTAMSKIAGQSAVYFKRQQSDLGVVNGYIEEMMSGQKVIKVFTHEQETKDGFDQVNEQLFDSAYQANKFANILMPVKMCIRDRSYSTLGSAKGASVAKVNEAATRLKRMPLDLSLIHICTILLSFHVPQLIAILIIYFLFLLFISTVFQ